MVCLYYTIAGFHANWAFKSYNLIIKVVFLFPIFLDIFAEHDGRCTNKKIFAAAII